MGLSTAWKRSQNLLHCVFVMTWRHYQGFPGKWCGCVDFIQHGVYSSGNNCSLAGFKKALLCSVVGVLWRHFLIFKSWGSDGQRWGRGSASDLSVCSSSQTFMGRSSHLFWSCGSGREKDGKPAALQTPQENVPHIWWEAHGFFSSSVGFPIRCSDTCWVSTATCYRHSQIVFLRAEALEYKSCTWVWINVALAFL